MIRLFCLLSDAPLPEKVTHYIIPQAGSWADRHIMPPPQFLIIEATAENAATGAMLYRFDGAGECVGDTWHKNIEEAKISATAEYEDLLGEWQEIHKEIETNTFVEKIKKALRDASN